MTLFVSFSDISRTRKGLKRSFSTQLSIAPLKYKGIPAVTVLALRKIPVSNYPSADNFG